MEPCEYHELVEDRFSKLPGVRRYVPGDFWCLKCHQPVAAIWNNGKPQWIDEQQATDAAGDR